MTTPNILTFARFLMAAVGCACLLITFPFHVTVATVIFVIAATTDWLDGVLARRWQMLSPLGAFMDPLADKILVFLYFAHLMTLGLFPEWLFLAALARDLMHDGMRNFAASNRVVLPANGLSKMKTVLQMASLVIVLALLSATEITGTAHAWGPILLRLSLWMMIGALVCGVLGSIRFIEKSIFLLVSGE